MKINSLIVGFGFLTLLAGCAGDKNEVAGDGNAVLLVRTLEAEGGVTGDELNQIAIIEGDFETPEALQAAAERAEWTSVPQFSQDDEISFVEEEQLSTARRGTDDRPVHNRGRNDRPVRRGQNDNRPRRGQQTCRGRNCDGHVGNRGRQYNDRDHGRWRRPRRQHDRFKSWQWAQPDRRYYGFDICSHQRILVNGRCRIPISRRYRHSWAHSWGYSTTMYVHPRPRYRAVRRHCRVRVFSPIFNY